MIELIMIEITKTKIREYAREYDKRNKGTNDEFVEREIKKWLKSHHYLDREEFIKIGMWKSPRPKRHYENNDNLTIKKITQTSFIVKDERQVVELLLGSRGGLKGVGYPVASAILHFAFPNRYPILDFRVIWSLGWEQPKSYNFDFWQKYCNEIRGISKGIGENIRTIDKAFWEHSKENKPAYHKQCGIKNFN